MRPRLTVLLALIACSFLSLGFGLPDGGTKTWMKLDDAGLPTDWGYSSPEESCDGWVTRLADRCDYEFCHQTPGGEGYGGDSLACGEVRSVCGLNFRCDCIACRPDAGYESRWTHDRHVDRVITGYGFDRLTVSYDGGACKADLFEDGLVSGSESSFIGAARASRASAKR